MRGDIIDISQLSLTIDTREKDQSRIRTISRYFKERGACVNINKLDTLDYHISGYYNSIEVNLGIEYKTGSDFAGNQDELHDRFARASLEYDNIGLILEHDHEKIIDATTKYTEVTLLQYKVNYETGMTITTNYHGLKNTLRSYERDGVLCGEISGLYEFPRMCIAFLNYITADDHIGISFENYNQLNVLMKIPGIGVNKASKLLNEFGSIYNVMIADDDKIMKCIGNKNGEKFIEYIKKVV